MTRRELFGAALTSLTLAPFFARQAFAGRLSCPTPSERRRALAEARQRAKDAAKPLLVLTVPTDPRAAYGRGTALGEWLNHGGDAALAQLAQVEVCCATAAELGQVLGQPVEGPDPVFWLVDGDQITPLTAELSPGSTARKRGGEDLAGLEAEVDRHIQALSRLLAGALAPTAAARAERAARGMDATAQKALQGAAIGTAALAAVDRRAAWLLHTRKGDAAVVTRLAAAARERIVAPRIPGSLWVRGGGCGEEIEGVPDDQQELVDCGMGFVAERSARFLRFWTQAGCGT